MPLRSYSMLRGAWDGLTTSARRIMQPPSGAVQVMRDGDCRVRPALKYRPRLSTKERAAANHRVCCTPALCSRFRLFRLQGTYFVELLQCYASTQEQAGDRERNESTPNPHSHHNRSLSTRPTAPENKSIAIQPLLEVIEFCATLTEGQRFHRSMI